MEDDILPLAEAIIALALKQGARITTAESCTGGLISAALTEVPGASEVIDSGFVTYSNAAKQASLHIPPAILENFGVVSKEVARAMAQGAIIATHPRTTHAVSVTGIAGPGGGSAEKPVGLVCFGLASSHNAAQAHHEIFENKGRSFIRTKTVLYALSLLKKSLL